MRTLHGLGHISIKESIRRIATYYFWNDMKTEITQFCQTCHGCQSAKPTKFKPPHLGHFEVPDSRFSHIHIDIVGPLPESQGYKHLLTTIDRTTRLFSALPVKDTSARTCAQAFLLHHVALYGIPEACTSDQGSNFVSELFKEMQKDLGIDIKRTPIYWPQGNGLLERSHQTLKNSIKAQLVEMGEKYQDKWMDYLPWALLGRRTAFNQNLKTSSAEMTLGFHPRIPMTLCQEVKEDEEPRLEEILDKMRFKNNRIAVPTSTNKQEPVPPPPPSVTHVYTRQHNTKGLQCSWAGPFEILSRPTRSSIEIRVGLTPNLTIRTERRAWGDCKPAYRRKDGSWEAPEAERPKRGRPSKKPKPVEEAVSTDQDGDPPFHGFASQEALDIVSSMDFSKPPPSLSNLPVKTTAWTASVAELAAINNSISSRHLA